MGSVVLDRGLLALYLIALPFIITVLSWMGRHSLTSSPFGMRWITVFPDVMGMDLFKFLGLRLQAKCSN